jgi:hypothetical protein
MQAKIPSTLPCAARAGAAAVKCCSCGARGPTNAAAPQVGTAGPCWELPPCQHRLHFGAQCELHHSPHHRYGRAEHPGNGRRGLVVLEVFKEVVSHHAAVFHYQCGATSSGDRLARDVDGRSRSLGRFSPGKVSRGSREARFSNRIGYQIGREERRRVMPCLTVWRS